MVERVSLGELGDRQNVRHDRVERGREERLPGAVDGHQPDDVHTSIAPVSESIAMVPTANARTTSAASITRRRSTRQRHAAVEDAHAVTGVDAVYDELNLRPLPHDPHDDEIRGTALQLLIRDPRVPETTIDVAVADRWVTLKREVRHQHERDAAFEDVEKLEGVGGITNAIKVVAAPGMG